MGDRRGGGGKSRRSPPLENYKNLGGNIGDLFASGVARVTGARGANLNFAPPPQKIPKK